MRGTKAHLKQEGEALQDLPAPAYFGAEAAAEWNRVFPLLRQRKILTTADLGGLENYCEAIGLAREMAAEVKKLGAVQKVYAMDKDGTARLLSCRKNPAVSIQKDAVNTARLLASELGLTPVSRSRPTVTNDDEEDDLFNF